MLVFLFNLFLELLIFGKIVAITALGWIVSFEKTILEIKPTPGVQILQIEGQTSVMDL